MKTSEEIRTRGAFGERGEIERGWCRRRVRDVRRERASERERERERMERTVGWGINART